MSRDFAIQASKALFLLLDVKCVTRLVSLSLEAHVSYGVVEALALDGEEKRNLFLSLGLMPCNGSCRK